MRRKAQAGFTLLEVGIVIGIISLIAAILLPMLSKVKYNAKIMQCQNNLKELHSALTLYQSFQGRIYSSYPDRLTHLYDLQYVPDQRLFVCPADTTGAQAHANLALNVLKPGSPADTKANWAERVNSPYQNADNDPRQRNCSYLYEFSTRPAQTYIIDPTDPTGQSDYLDPNSTWGTWPSDFLVEWFDDGTGVLAPCSDATGDQNFGSLDYFGVPCPDHISKFGLLDPSDPTGQTGLLTWQEVKFWQMDQGDICCTGLASPGFDNAYPAGWFPAGDDPWDMIDFVTLFPQRGYKDTWIPIVRCFWHQTPALVDNEAYLGVLNLAVGGNTFMSAPGWEQTAWEYGRDAGEISDTGP
jgi:prepilin-type N-terminal cleavage/methylation domain-containing protein